MVFLILETNRVFKYVELYVYFFPVNNYIWRLRIFKKIFTMNTLFVEFKHDYFTLILYYFSNLFLKRCVYSTIKSYD